MVLVRLSMVVVTIGSLALGAHASTPRSGATPILLPGIQMHGPVGDKTPQLHPSVPVGLGDMAATQSVAPALARPAGIIALPAGAVRGSADPSSAIDAHDAAGRAGADVSAGSAMPGASARDQLPLSDAGFTPAPADPWVMAARIPLPTSAILLLGALGGLAVISRQRRAALR